MVALKGTALVLLPLFVASTLPMPAQDSVTKMEAAALPGYSASASGGPSVVGRGSFARCLRRTTCVRTCGGSARVRTMSALRMTRTMRSGFLRSSNDGGWMRISRRFMYSSPRPRSARSNWWRLATFTAKLQEPPVAGDPTSLNPAGRTAYQVITPTVSMAM